jgi:hypothetical protein
MAQKHEHSVTIIHSGMVSTKFLLSLVYSQKIITSWTRTFLNQALTISMSTKESSLLFLEIWVSMGILFPVLRRNEVSTRYSSFFLIFLCFANCILGILSFWANIHLSVSAYQVILHFFLSLSETGCSPCHVFLSLCSKVEWMGCLICK